MMTGSEAYWYTLALISFLLAVVLPLIPFLMGIPAGATRWRSLRAGVAGAVLALLLATIAAVFVPAGPLRSGTSRAADDLSILFSISSGLAVMLGGVGPSIIVLYRDLGIISGREVRGTAAAMVSCWCLVVGVFAYLVVA